MLIEFQVQNFRSFRERQTFSMVAASFSEHRESNTFDPEIKGFGGLLRSAVVYGPNAAGKTNLLRAVQFAQTLIVNSAATTSDYPYTPFKFSATTREAPSEFEFTIVQNGIRYEYGFTMGPNRFEKEWLIEYANPRGRAMFKRTYDARKKDIASQVGCLRPSLMLLQHSDDLLFREPCSLHLSVLRQAGL